MKILVLQGSPNRSGLTTLLCDEFERGAREAGNDVERIDVAYAGIEPCTGCVACGYEGPCVQSDGMDELRGKILSSDMVVFATPLYYYGRTSHGDYGNDTGTPFSSRVRRALARRRGAGGFAPGG